jgi:hypothetical protein
MMVRMARTDIGFQGGQVLSLRADEGAYKKLIGALQDDRTRPWHALESEDERIEIDLSQVVYVRRETEGQKVGF